jgi:muramoyltetrapeptide carboxypeptidase
MTFSVLLHKITSMITPPYLKPGDSVAIVAPARKVTEAEIMPAIGRMNEWGWNVSLSTHLFGECNQYSGTDEERASDLQQMLDDPDIKAIFAARGGYGTVRIIDRLDFKGFCRNPKWIVGFSDVTVLDSHIHNQFGIETLHAAMPFTFPAEGEESETLVTLRKALSGQKLEYQIASDTKNIQGNAGGVLVGGNLSILYTLNGTPSDLDTRGKILFIEDLDEYLYHIDRMMQTLKRSGKLDNLAGLVVGGMTKMNDNSVPFGMTAEEIIHETIKEYEYPVCFGFPAGHVEDNCALIMGREVRLAVQEKGCILSFVS